MLNYRVRNLDAMLAQLRAGGGVVEDRVEEYEYGRFGWAMDPEGNRFELWHPLPNMSLQETPGWVYLQSRHGCRPASLNSRPLGASAVAWIIAQTAEFCHAA
jgi:hypothetical protein